MIVLKVGMSISFGIIANSDIVRGAIGLAGDLGHIPDPTSDIVCTCGQRGCAVAVARARDPNPGHHRGADPHQQGSGSPSGVGS